MLTEARTEDHKKPPSREKRHKDHKWTWTLSKDLTTFHLGHRMTRRSKAVARRRRYDLAKPITETELRDQGFIRKCISFYSNMHGLAAAVDKDIYSYPKFNAASRLLINLFRRWNFPKINWETEKVIYVMFVNTVKHSG